MWFHSHKHEWEEVDRQFGEVQRYSGMIFGSKPIGSARPYTLITYKCRTCPKHYQVHLEGIVGAEDSV